jgi:integral membrane protein (TIGR01906 family)
MPSQPLPSGIGRGEPPQTMKVIDAVFRWFFVLCLPLLLLSAAFRIPANSAFFYEYLFNKYQVGTTTGLDKAALRATAQGMVDYFNSNQEYIDLTVTKDGQPFKLFNEREIVHLRDVKGLFRFDLIVLVATGVFAAAYAISSILRKGDTRRKLARAALIGGGLTLALMAAMGIGMLFDFDSLLLQFHLLSFANDFWQLDPTRDYLIMLITHGVMYDGAFTVAGATVLGALLVGGAGVAYLLYTRRRERDTNR